MTAKQPGSELSNDVQTIRQILFGEQLHSIQEHIEALGDAIAALQNETRVLRQDLEIQEKNTPQGIHRIGNEARENKGADPPTFFR